MSVIHVEIDRAAADRRTIAAQLRRLVRQCDLVCDLGDDGLLVALPATGGTMASGMAAEIRRALGGPGIGPVRSSTGWPGADAEDLVARVRDGGPSRSGGAIDGAAPAS